MISNEVGRHTFVFCDRMDEDCNYGQRIEITTSFWDDGFDHHLIGSNQIMTLKDNFHLNFSLSAAKMTPKRLREFADQLEALEAKLEIEKKYRTKLRKNNEAK